MISKELLSEVLGRECSYVSLIENDVWYKTIVCVNGNNRPKEVHINIYELAHKCKEWAYSNCVLCYCNEFNTQKIKLLDAYEVEL